MTYTVIDTETRPSTDVEWWVYGQGLPYTLDVLHAYFKMTVEIIEKGELVRIRIIHFENEEGYHAFVGNPDILAGIARRDEYHKANNIITNTITASV